MNFEIGDIVEIRRGDDSVWEYRQGVVVELLDEFVYVKLFDDEVIPNPSGWLSSSLRHVE